MEQVKCYLRIINFLFRPPMKPKLTLLLLIPLLAMSFLIKNDPQTTGINLNTLDQQLIGEWEYKISFSDSSYFTVPFNRILPVQNLRFEHCRDSSELERFPKIVIAMRKHNSLENISCKAYNENNEVIDTYYPVVLFGNDSLVKQIDISQYGHTLKSEYTIYTLTSDSLIIGDGKLFETPSGKMVNVKHVYIRQH